MNVLSCLDDALVAVNAQPIPAGHCRLYRVEPQNPVVLSEWLQQALAADGSLQAQGRWFTEDVEALPFYAQDQAPAPSVLRWIDLPVAEAEERRVAQLVAHGGETPGRFSRDPHREFFLTPDQAHQAFREPLVTPGRTYKRGPRA